MGRQLSFSETETGDPETPEFLTKGPLSLRGLHACCFQPVTPVIVGRVTGQVGDTRQECRRVWLPPHVRREFGEFRPGPYRNSTQTRYGLSESFSCPPRRVSWPR